MVSRYEEIMYRDIHRIADALEELVKQQKMSNAIQIAKSGNINTDDILRLVGMHD